MSITDKVTDINIVDEMNNSFLDYAMSVIVSRALPDVRDGLKPVHRRILYAMNDLNNTADKPYKKSARIVGDCIGKYHPHGDTSVYDAMVRMAQEFSYREPLVDGQGNFGSIDGDGAAAMRYTEARMAKLAMELLRDINKETIDFQDNYDASEREPIVLPARFPNLLVNGATGIAVGMATSIPPHNLGEVIDGVIAYINDNEITIPGLMKYIKGPDFPLGANILGSSGFAKAYETGNGSVKVRSEYEVFEEKNGKSTIIITEIPFQVNKSTLVEKIADCVKDKRVEGITDLRDESNREGIRIVIELSKNVTPEVILNNLFKFTQLESSFSMNMLALVHGVPKILNLKEFIKHYVDHQVIVTRRKAMFELKKAQERAHILQGYVIALDNIEQVIKIIRGSQTDALAMESLMSNFELSEKQSKAIMDMQLRRLTGLQREKIQGELDELLSIINSLNELLNSDELVFESIKENLINMRAKYANERRSKVIEGYFDSSMNYEELIEEQNVIITLTKSGYIKRILPEHYRTQSRGGKGTIGMKVNEEDTVSNVLFTSTHADLLFFTNTGRVFKTRVHKVPEYSRTAKGLPLINLVDILDGEKITKIISIKDYEENSYLMFVTKYGLGKKTLLSEYEKIQKNGKRAIGLNENDEVKSVLITTDSDELIVSTSNGKSLRCSLSQFRSLSRVARGVRALKLDEGEAIVGADVIEPTDMILSVSENGFGKATEIENFRVQGRGGKGVKSLKVTEKTGQVVSVMKLNHEEMQSNDLLLITKQGQVIRICASAVKISGRATQGVTLMRLNSGDLIANVEFIKKDESNVEDEE